MYDLLGGDGHTAVDAGGWNGGRTSLSPSCWWAIFVNSCWWRQPAVSPLISEVPRCHQSHGGVSRWALDWGCFSCSCLCLSYSCVSHIPTWSLQETSEKYSTSSPCGPVESTLQVLAKPSGHLSSYIEARLHHKSPRKKLLCSSQPILPNHLTKF